MSKEPTVEELPRRWKRVATKLMSFARQESDRISAESYKAEAQCLETCAKHLEAALKREQREPVGWGVFGRLLDHESAVTPQYITESKQEAHDFINDCVNGSTTESITEAARWTVRPLYAKPPQESEG